MPVIFEFECQDCNRLVYDSPELIAARLCPLQCLGCRGENLVKVRDLPPPEAPRLLMEWP